MRAPLIFVYGTLRQAYHSPMAAWLRSVAHPVGRGWISGALYHVADYPGFVPGSDGWVIGDLFHLSDAEAQLALLDTYEECSPDFPEPREYRREWLKVETANGPVSAWVYVYARDVAGLARVSGGDFLEGRKGF